MELPCAPRAGAGESGRGRDGRQSLSFLFCLCARRRVDSRRPTRLCDRGATDVGSAATVASFFRDGKASAQGDSTYGILCLTSHAGPPACAAQPGRGRAGAVHPAAWRAIVPRPPCASAAVVAATRCAAPGRGRDHRHVHPSDAGRSGGVPGIRVQAPGGVAVSFFIVVREREIIVGQLRERARRPRFFVLTALRLSPRLSMQYTGLARSTRSWATTWTQRNGCR